MSKNTQNKPVSASRDIVAQILRLRAEGMSVKAIARTLHKRDKFVSAVIKDKRIGKPAQKSAATPAKQAKPAKQTKPPKSAKTPTPAPKKRPLPPKGAFSEGYVVESISLPSSVDAIRLALTIISILKTVFEGVKAWKDQKPKSCCHSQKSSKCSSRKSK